jgi:hypothetical protein
MVKKPEGYHEDLYLEHLEQIAQEDVAGLKAAQHSYGNSWKQRGGVGAYMMAVRKADRLENRVSRSLGRTVAQRFQRYVEQVSAGGDVLFERDGHVQLLQDVARLLEEGGGEYDIFAHIFADQRAEGVIDDIRDLRRYLALVEAEARALGFSATHRDNRPDAG